MIDLAPDILMVLTLVIPFVAAFLIPLFYAAPNLRELVTLTASIALFLVVVSLVPAVMDGGRPEALRFTMVEGVSFGLKLEPLGMLFMLVAATLWIVNSIYSIGYMRGNDEKRQTQFYVCFAIAIASTMALALSANLFTLFIFYEVLTLSTYPLVAHKGNDEARNGGRVYLLILLGTSMLLFLPAIIITYAITGTTEFTPGGILQGNASDAVIALLIGLFAFGIGKAGLMPFHFWLPSAMVAPTPVSALLHAVAVVKAGVFTILKVVIYIFGIDTLRISGQAEWLVYFVSFSVLAASMVALAQNNLKARLAYSTVSQLGYIVLAAMLATAASVQGGALHIVMHAVGKITLFMCAGAIYVAHHKTEISDLDGIGRKMPVTMFAFFIAALSIIGLPPLGGVWSKWFLAIGALEAEYQFAVAVFMISSLLNVAYLIPIVMRAFFRAPADAKPGEVIAIQEAPIFCVIPICITAFGCLLLFFFADTIMDFIQLIDLKPVSTGGLNLVPDGSVAQFTPGGASHAHS